MILDDIIEKRKIQLLREKSEISPEEMKKAALSCTRKTLNFRDALNAPGISIISEVKKASPSKKVICEDFHPAEQAVKYEKAGASAISCLTEEFYFQGSSRCLKEIREKVNLPILRKDFIIDEYQIYEAKVIGADAVLLISAILDTETIIKFMDTAKSLELNCLCEIHNEDELRNLLPAKPDIIGINNRNLKTFDVSLKTTGELAAKLPEGCTVVSESGISTSEDMKLLRSYGADAVLIGETLMRAENVEEKIAELRRGII